MPYITQADRDAMERGEPPRNAGELNYRLTTQMLARDAGIKTLKTNLRGICELYLSTMQKLTAGPMRYTHLNDVSGALLNAGLEFKRRTGRTWEATIFLGVAAEVYNDIAAPYEETKIRENGDICYE